MNSRSVSFSSPFRWLLESLSFSGGSKIQLLIAVQFAVVVMFLPSVLQGLMGPSIAVQLITTGLAIVFMPPVMVGVMRLFERESRNEVFSARDALQVFREPSRWTGSIVLHIFNLLLMMLVLGTLMSAFLGEAYLRELLQVMQTTQPGKPTQLPALPEGAAAGIALMMELAILLMSLQYLSYTRYAQTEHSAIRCWVQSLLAVLKNSVTLLLFYFIAGFAAMLVLGILSIMIVLIATALGAISPILAAIVIVPAYFVLAVVMMYVMLGFHHRAHREIFSAPEAPPSAAMI